ncbi:hypothetical protein J6590_013753 [Homalodisca vitripennis]|nr:hypothetical protein J6590_013753 [Homalodisca vitripennis]
MVISATIPGPVNTLPVVEQHMVTGLMNTWCLLLLWCCRHYVLADNGQFSHNTCAAQHVTSCGTTYGDGSNEHMVSPIVVVLPPLCSGRQCTHSSALRSLFPGTELFSINI